MTAYAQIRLGMPGQVSTGAFLSPRVWVISKFVPDTDRVYDYWGRVAGCT